MTVPEMNGSCVYSESKVHLKRCREPSKIRHKLRLEKTNHNLDRMSVAVKNPKKEMFVQ